MKKYLFLMIALVGLVGMSGCEKTEVIETIMPNKTFIYTVSPGDWVLSNNRTTLEHDINLPELDRYYMDQGNVSVAASFDGEGSYDILPSTFEGLAYSVNYAVGSVLITVKDPLADPNITLSPPTGDIIFKIVLSESDYIE
ncbi:hypothetical protein [Olivibacter sp. XZL3]|uniref:hypothetical protein n=1 Tax=Olivibacter sp. XZL3 TaxID=1735116 RepID=UPI001064DFF2|nr:hypothetical protein [Olivibacter sp. XZL3]